MATVTAQRRRQRGRKRKKTAEPAACCATLPGHLLAEVLLRVPARSLAGLRSTCRSWNAEISSRGFQERHHALAAARFAFLKYARRPHSYTAQAMRRGRPAGTWMARCTDCPRVVAGSNSKACCGLVLVGRRCGGYFVCNPTTGETLRLPRSHQRHCATGFGFHAPSGEFKVVQIVSVSLQQGEVQLQATVLTVGDARGWRAPAATGNDRQASLGGFTGDAKIEIVIENHVQPVLADGRLHWSFRTEYLDKPRVHGHGVICFSLADESFRLVPQPAFSTVECDGDDEDQQHRSQLRRVYGGMPVGKTVAELDGRLCMVRDLRHRSDVGSLLFEIWKLQDYDTGSWSLDYRVDLTPAAGHMAERLRAPWLVVPLRYLDDGGGSPPADKRKLLLATTAQEAHIYDPASGTLQTVASSSTAVGGGTGGEDDEEHNNSVRLVLYQESLVRFHRMKKGKGKIQFLQLEQL